MSTLFAAKLPAAASLDSNSANRLSALWLVIESRGEAHDIALRESLASIKKLNKVADFSIQVILISKAPQDATQYEAILGQDIPVHYKQSIGSALTLPNAEDLIGFLRPGDTIMPEFAQAIQNCTNSIPEFIVSDLFFQDQGRVFPVLLPGLNYCHALNCDYFRSRFFSNAGVARLVSSGDEEISPRDLSLRVFERIYADEKWDSARHIALPLIGIQDSIVAIGEERQALSASDTPALSAHGNVVGAKSAIPPHCVSIIICTKDKGYLLRQLVTHILATKSDLISGIVIISNQTSAPHALRALSDLAASEKIRVVNYDGAFNFSDQCNLGAKYAKGEYFLFLNDDIAPVSDDWLEELVLPAMNKRVSLVAPLLIYPDERVQHAGMYLGYNNIAGHQLRAAHFPEDEYMFLCSAPRFVSVVTGAAMLIPPERFELLNGFDTNFATYIQDVDLCLRIGASGHDIVFNPRSILIHMESPSIKKMLSNEPVMHTRAKEYELFRRRWEGKLNRDAFHNENYDLNDESMRSLIS